MFMNFLMNVYRINIPCLCVCRSSINRFLFFHLLLLNIYYFLTPLLNEIVGVVHYCTVEDVEDTKKIC